MGLSLNMNVMNQIVKGVSIYEENEPVESICLVLKGRVVAHRDGIQTILGSGNFLGICDIYTGTNSVTYTAFDNAVVYPFPIKTAQDIRSIIQKNNEYGGLMVASLSRYIRDLRTTMEAYSSEAEQFYLFLKDYYELYKSEVIKADYEVRPIEEFENLRMYGKNLLLDTSKAEYYSECAGVAVDIQKAFYQNETISIYHIEEQTELARQLILECSEIASYLKDNMKILFSDSENSLFRRTARFIMELNNKKINPSREIVDSIDRMIEKINAIDTQFDKKAGEQLDIDRDALENLYYIIISGETPVEEVGLGIRAKIATLANSLHTIFEAGDIKEEVREEFCQLLDTYKGASDKTATDDASRKLRKQIAVIYYDIYRSVFLKMYNKKECPLAVDLFLNYGFIDEKLLRSEQIEELVELEGNREIKGPCAVYSMKQWLTLIYLGKKLPSKSEFDLDYEEYLRSLRKSNEITDEELTKRSQDMNMRLDYEIQNMFQYNNRLVNGQILTFVPFLHENSFITGIRKTYVTAERINQAVLALEKVDYSIFTREVIYNNDELDIKREYVVKKVYPDIIIFPVAGDNTIMWQEISGRRRDSKGRFLMPSFTIKNLEDMLVKAFGRFHWEICRTIQGSAWNNIKYKSLTSEYMDYIQFYRKNHDLSEEKKEKLKAQIQKSRNNSKEVFVMDYEAWIRNEAQGAIRLNKVVREMMAMYCPFAKEIREGVKGQPMFQEAMARFNKELATKIRNLELRVHALEKDGKDVPEEILSTLNYYKNS